MSQFFMTGAVHEIKSKFAMLFALFLSQWVASMSLGRWTYHGRTEVDTMASYGFKDILNASNHPGGRESFCGSVSKDSFYIFGGRVQISQEGQRGTSGITADLWKYNLGSKLWTWISGPSSASVKGNYKSAKGAFSSSNYPGSRSMSSMATIGSTLYVFGGVSPESNTAYYNELWAYNIDGDAWAWLSGSSVVKNVGVYGPVGVFASEYWPRSRKYASMTVMLELLYMFGGGTSETNGRHAYVNDLWAFNTSSLEWAWLRGSKTLNTPGKYAALGSHGMNSYPGARRGSSMTSTNRELVLFGGMGYNHEKIGTLNDLWLYITRTGVWVWTSGSSTVNTNGVSGEKIDFSSEYSPAGRENAVMFLNRDWLVLFGGYGANAVSDKGWRADLWFYSFTREHWMWVSGNTKYNKDSDAMSNVAVFPYYPGARQNFAGFAFNESLNFFGGAGFNDNRYGKLADIWVFETLKCQSGFGKEYPLTTCELCEPGKYSNRISCELCPRGRYSNSSGLTLCAECSFGYESDKNASACFECVAGKFSDAFGCYNCPKGFISTQNSSKECQRCLDGYESESGATQCLPCSIGKFLLDFTCTSCPIGRFSNSTASSICFKCLKGFGSEKESTTCSSCIQGKYSTGKQCLPCGKGKYSSVTQASVCLDCAHGFIPFRNHTACRTCLAGTFAYDGRSCKICPRNSYSTDAAINCNRCRAYSWTENAGGTGCETCWPSGGTNASSYVVPIDIKTRSQCQCAAGYYGTPFISPAVCVKCKDSEGVACGQNSSLPQIAKGFSRSKTDPSFAYRCIPPESCPGTDSMETICALGYEGENCGVCEPSEYYRKGLKCVKCTFLANLNFIAFILFVMVFLFVVLKNSVPSNRKIHAIVICLFWLQIFDAVSSTVEEWPPAVSWLFALISSVNLNLDLISPECSFEVNYWTRWHLKMTATLLLGAMQLYYFVIQEFNIAKWYLFDISFMDLLSKCSLKYAIFAEGNKSEALERPTADNEVKTANQEIDDLYPYRFSRFVYAFGNLVNSLYVLIARTSFEMFRCNRQPDGLFLMEKFVGQKCFDSYWYQILVTNICFSSLILIGFPAWLLRLLKREKNNLETKDFVKNYGPFCVYYRPEVYWWPVVEIVFKLSLVMCTDILTFYFPQIGHIAVILLLFAYERTFYSFKPYNTYLNMVVSQWYVWCAYRILTFSWLAFIILDVVCLMLLDPKSGSVVAISILIMIVFFVVLVFSVLSVRYTMYLEEEVVEKTAEQ